MFSNVTLVWYNSVSDTYNWAKSAIASRNALPVQLISHFLLYIEITGDAVKWRPVKNMSKRDLSNPKTCLNQTLSNPKTCLNQTLSNPKTCLNQTLCRVPFYKFKCILNLVKPNTCLNWSNFKVPKEFGIDRSHCTSVVAFSKYTLSIIQNIMRKIASFFTKFLTLKGRSFSNV